MKKFLKNQQGVTILTVNFDNMGAHVTCDLFNYSIFLIGLLPCVAANFVRKVNVLERTCENFDARESSEADITQLMKNLTTIGLVLFED